MRTTPCRGTREQLRRAFSHLPDADSLDVCYSIRLNSLTMSFCDRAEEAMFKKGDLSDADLDSLLSKKAERTSWFSAVRSARWAAWT
ncbi:MAG: hypothetical protein IPP26_16600 [Flavobacteriales bacterium]|nr:hypothetical protein [Flavobacteriales bacterium]